MQRRVYQTPRDEWRSCQAQILAVIVVAAIAIAFIAASRARYEVPPELLGTWDLVEPKTPGVPSTAWEFAPGNTYIKYTQGVSSGSYYVVDVDTIALSSGCPYPRLRRLSRNGIGCPAEMIDFRLEKDMLRLTRSQDSRVITETYQRRNR